MRCRLCQSQRIRQKYDITRCEPNFILYECWDCGFQFQNIDRELAYRFYDEAYYTGNEGFTYLDERRQEEASAIVWKSRVRKLVKADYSDTSVGVKRFLDIGCSFGGLLNVAKGFEYEPYGVEVSRYSGDYAQKRFGNDRIFIGNIEEIPLGEDEFSVVTMIEVIEHLFDPLRALNNVYRAMKKGGVLLIQTADMAGLQALWAKERYHYYLPGHLSYFTRKNLGEILHQCGFSKTRFIGGVEFGLIPKLRKSQASFTRFFDYLRWFRIAFYHYWSKVSLLGLHMTSSMVYLAWK